MTRWFFARCGLQACKTRTRSICWPKVVKGVPDLEAYNFETAEHIDRRISDVSSRINTLQNGTKWGPSPNGVFLQLREKVGQR